MKLKQAILTARSSKAYILVGTTGFEPATSRTPSDFRIFSYLIKTNQNALESVLYMGHGRFKDSL